MATFSVRGLIRRILAISFIAGTTLGVGGFYLALRSQALADAKVNSRLLVSAASAVRSYTDERVFPVMSQLPSDEFHEETVPSFAAQSVFRRVATEFPDYSYRETALNPTNSADRPTSAEVEIINAFRSNTALAELSGIRDEGGNSLFYLARPIRVKDGKCLSCHGKSDAAPASLIAKFGASNGFGWRMDETVGIQMLSIPVTKELRRAVELALALGLALVGLFGVTYLALTLALERALVRPLVTLSEAAEALSREGEPRLELPQGGATEIARLSNAIKRLRASVENAIRRAMVARRGD